MAATVVVANGNFHGRTTTIVGFSDDPQARDDFGPVRARVRHCAVRRRRRDRGRDHRRHRGRAHRADPGRGRRRRFRPRATSAPCARSARGTTCSSSPTRSSPVSAASARRSRATARASCPTSTCSARRWAAASCPSRPSSPTPTCSGSSAPASTARRSAATRSRRRSDCGSSRCSSRASSRTRAPALGEHLEATLSSRSSATASPPCASRDCGRASTSTPPSGPAARSPSGCSARGVLVKDTHGQTIRIAPPLVVRATELDWAIEQLRFVLAG